MGFLRQEYWRGLPLPSPGDLTDPGIKSVSPALAGRFFTIESPGKPNKLSRASVSTGFPRSSAGKESAYNAGDPSSIPGIPWRRDRLLTPVFLGFPGGSDNKESTCNVGDLGSIPGLGKSPGEGHGNPLQYSCLENPQGQRSLAGCSLRRCKELDMTELLKHG